MSNAVRTISRDVFRIAILGAVVAVGLGTSRPASAVFVPYAVEAAWQAAAAPTALENFEGYGANVQIANLPGLGIEFDVLAGGGHPVTYFFGGTPHGPMHLANFPNGINAINQFDDIVLRPMAGFDLTALGFWNGDGQAATLVATAYDEFDNVLGSVGAFRGTFAGFTSDTAVARVVFDGNTGDGWNHLDGLQTHVNRLGQAPEPPAWPLVAAGVAVVLVRRRSVAARRGPRGRG